MGLVRAFKVALQSLAANKLRSILAILGIVIGVSAVIMMVGLGQGAQARIERMISRMGVNLVFVWPQSMRRGHGHSRSYRAETLTVEDAEAIGKLPHLRVVVPEIRRHYQIKYMNRNEYARVNGTMPGHLIARDFELDHGRYFDRAAVRSRLRVCVLGARISEELFEDIDPVGRYIQINRQHFEVLGVLKDKGGDTWAELDQSVYVPVTTAMYRLFNRTHISQITISVEAPEYLDETMISVERVLMSRHRIRGDSKPDFRISSMEDMRERFSSATRAFTVLLAGIAAISLLVGGIGIMNIMLVSVTERTREIGIRKAVGARRSDMLIQFLIESMAISLLGGILGILFGVGVTKLVPTLEVLKKLSGGEPWEFVITAWPIVVSFGFCVFVGIFFGLYPAIKASRLHPVDALRYE